MPNKITTQKNPEADYLVTEVQIPILKCKLFKLLALFWLEI